MISDQTQARHLANLSYIQSVLHKNTDLITQLLEPSEEAPLPTLTAVLPTGDSQLINPQPTDPQPPWGIAFTFVPFDAETIAAIELLHFYSVVPADLQPKYSDEMAKLLIEVNRQSIIGTFTLNEQGKLIFRYTYTVSSFQGINPIEFLEIVELCLNVMDNYRSLIQAVGTGDRTLESVLKALEPPPA